MLDPQRPLADYLDDFVHGVLSESDAARVQAWLDTAPEAPALLAAARRRRMTLLQLPPAEASEPLIQRTLERLNQPVTRRAPRVLKAAQLLAAIAALAMIAIAGANLYYYQLRPSPYSVRLIGQAQWLSGTQTSLRLAVMNEQSEQALADIPLSVSLIDPLRKRSVSLASFRTRTDSLPAPRLELPNWEPGNYLLRVSAETPDGTRVLEESVQLRRSTKLYLTTDKPIYQPGQLIHMRALALRRPDLKPAQNESVEFKLFDSKNNAIFKRRIETSKFGLAATDCQLATEINTGDYRVECVINDTTSVRTIKVEKYVLPKFKLNVTLDRPFYAPTDKLAGKLVANYFFGQPVKGGAVQLELRTTDVTNHLLERQTLQTDDQGRADFTFTLPEKLYGREQDSGHARVQLFATVTDTAGQSYSTVTTRLVTSEPLQIEVIPEGGALVRGLANVIYLHASYADGRPAETTIRINGEQQTVQTNALGVGQFELTPDTEQVNLTVVATDAAGKTARRHVTLACDAVPQDFIVRPNQAVYRAGDTMTLTVQGGGVEPVFIDLMKDGQSVLTETVDLNAGQGNLTIDLPPELFGSLQLVAYRMSKAGLAVRKSRLIFVESTQQLQLQGSLDQPVYRPGETAKLTFQLQDAAGRPTPGAISLAGVDEAVFAVLQQRPGLEQAFFLAEQELLRPIYTIYPDWTPAVTRNNLAPERAMLEQAVFALTAYSGQNETFFGTTYRRRDVMMERSADDINDNQPVFRASPFSLVTSTYPTQQMESYERRQQGLQAVTIAWFITFSTLFVCGMTTFAVLRPKAFVVSMAVMLVLLVCSVPLLLIGFFLSPSARFSVGVKAEYKSTESRHPLMDGEEASGAEGVSPSAPPRVRQMFPETLLWQPELITDEKGRATLDIDLADSITTWRISASAVSAAGQLGETQIPIRVFQPFFVDLNLPVALTRNDEVSVPVVVYNYLDQPQTVEVTLEEQPWFTLLATRADDAPAWKQTLTLQPSEVRSIEYRLKMLTVGEQQLQVTASAGNIADAVKRSVTVVPNGTLVEAFRNETLPPKNAPIAWEVTVPGDAIPGSVQAFVKIYPSGFSQLVEGLDAIFQMPYGCFEQTSSTTYPNVLALDYLRSTKQSVPQVEAKARQFIHLGYQRLVMFEAPGGGFDWFGRAPGNRTLTAYGLLEFVDMSRVHDVDPKLIDRTRAWLLAQQQPDGTWEPESHMLNDGLANSVNRSDSARLAATAYIARALFHSAPRETRTAQVQRQFQLTADYLLAQRPATIDDPYVLAMVALALGEFNPQQPELAAYLDRLVALKHEIGQQVYWQQPENAARPFHATGVSGHVETTALATL
ncbi:MAG TPA: MG2 domain-containing protein, partial [Pirellulaceae bacterium]|nr:MG2 domain-containing protein [Pirellulaceae bacterium]